MKNTTFCLYINDLNPDFQNFDFFLTSYNPFKCLHYKVKVGNILTSLICCNIHDIKLTLKSHLCQVLPKGFLSNAYLKSK